MIKVLYISSWHPVLEFDDLNLLTDLGFDWFSTGHYRNPQVSNKFFLRNTINKILDLNLYNEFISTNFLSIGSNIKLSDLINTPINISKSFADNFDIILVNNWISNLKDLNNFKDKCVIWRTYGNQSIDDEIYAKTLIQQGLKVARMFDFETKLNWANPACGLLRNYVDSTIYKDWSGQEEYLLTFQNHLGIRIPIRDSLGQILYPEYSKYLELYNKIPLKLYGLENKDIPYCRGCINWTDQLIEYKSNLAYLALPVKPSPYTYNFMEAFMLGIPTINFNKITQEYNHPIYGHTYQIPDIIKQGHNGFLVENSKDIEICFNILRQDRGLAQTISKNARDLAIQKFDKSIVLEEWRSFFIDLGFNS